ncbi:lipocalin-like domain-containing protein [Mucilaginibacter litoreus]|uniref:Lipocalin-like domain-containing protein n=1 Tax=Mucilaginibacter litoreus TaxID=1048221 RepID=A0ABW3AR11_9SPHI
MKVKLITSGVITLALSAFTSPSTPEKDIIGTWKIDDASVNTTVKHTIAKIIETNPDAAEQIEEHKDEIVDLVKGLRVVFRQDKTYESQSAQGTNAGTWEITDKGHTLKIDRKDGKNRKDSILEISATRLKLINRSLGDTAVFVHP